MWMSPLPDTVKKKQALYELLIDCTVKKNIFYSTFELHGALL
jgi:hypothetical protein